MKFHTLMVQGTTSDAGKSTIVAALCRLLVDRGVRVTPMKPQNMALNSAVTPEGGEIGRAQALQAQAARIAPHTDMNPVLLKPSSDTGAQIIVQGKVRADLSAKDYMQYKERVMPFVLESYQRLARDYEAVIVEGAGSPAEVNLRERDIANMGFAEAVDCPVILVADIDRGGVFAHFIGTLACLSESEQKRVIGFVINKFRGDLSLLEPGNRWLEEKTGKPVLGVVPYLHGLHLDAEDAISINQNKTGTFNIAVPVIPRISNHTDFDALRAHPDVNLIFVGPNQAIPACDLIILPGSKNTIADLGYLREQKWDVAIQKHLRYGGKVIGICGGMQMLGLSICDPLGVESNLKKTSGLRLLPIHTEMQADKQLRQVEGCIAFNPSEAIINAYEIHMGKTSVATSDATLRTAFKIRSKGSQDAFQDEGWISSDDCVMGTYLHGLFDHPEACAQILKWAGMEEVSAPDLNTLREASIQKMAEACRPILDSLCEIDEPTAVKTN